MGIRAEETGSFKRLQGMLKKGSSGKATFTRIKSDVELNVRFLDEPDKWIRYTEHYDQVYGYFPCQDEGDCVGCLEGSDKSQKFLAQVVDMDDKEVIALVLPYSLADDLAKRYDKRKTLCDRTYILSRTGTGKMDTSYSVDYEEPKKRDMSGYERLDLWAMLEAAIPVEEEEEDDKKSSRRSEAKKGRVPKNGGKDSGSRARSRDEDDDDDKGRQARRAVKKAVRPGLVRKSGSSGLSKSSSGEGGRDGVRRTNTLAKKSAKSGRSDRPPF